ncbi:hypothetical protein L7F22_010665 [Adiantum nelumboides]|nr:hypothetical protein [Adiantum nelumboides]
MAARLLAKQGKALYSLGGWSLEFGDSILVGYWSAKLCTHLQNKATVIEWGGEVAQAVSPSLPRRQTQTCMGSAQAGFGHASYFRNVEVVNSGNQFETITALSTSADHPSCYNIRSFYNSNWGNYFYDGGPGRNPSYSDSRYRMSHCFQKKTELTFLSLCFQIFLEMQ